MKSSVSGVLAILALLVAVGALLVALTRGDSGGRTGEPYDVAVAMGHLQRFAEKLHFAGAAGNWPLADFYLHEIEETVDAIAQANVMDEGVAVSSFMRSMFPPALGPMKEAVRARNAQQFAPAYENMLLSCNACHQATGHGFIKITVPRQPTYQNQDFRP
jgi:hypothetical protein